MLVPKHSRPRGYCGECGAQIAVRLDGRLRAHGFAKVASGTSTKPRLCTGSGAIPTDGSWVHRPGTAGFLTACCKTPYDALPEDDRISSDSRKVTCIGSSSTGARAVG